MNKTVKNAVNKCVALYNRIFSVVFTRQQILFDRLQLLSYFIPINISHTSTYYFLTIFQTIILLQFVLVSQKGSVIISNFVTRINATITKKKLLHQKKVNKIIIYDLWLRRRLEKNLTPQSAASLACLSIYDFLSWSSDSNGHKLMIIVYWQ